MILFRLFLGVLACGRHRRIRILLLVLTAVPAGAALAATDPLKVMFFNVRTPADTDDNHWSNRRDLMAQTIGARHRMSLAPKSWLASRLTR